MKPLDGYIRKNPELFDADEPLSGHFDRFDERLEKAGRRKTGFFIMKIAPWYSRHGYQLCSCSEFSFFNLNLDRFCCCRESGIERSRAVLYFAARFIL
jgi:hypothetical protein